MSLSKVEKERIADSLLKLHSVSTVLRRVDPSEVPGLENIEACLKDADQILGAALRSPASEQPGH